VDVVAVQLALPPTFTDAAESSFHPADGGGRGVGLPGRLSRRHKVRLVG
jgi:hypothetical protein